MTESRARPRSGVRAIERENSAARSCGHENRGTDPVACPSPDFATRGEIDVDGMVLGMRPTRSHGFVQDLGARQSGSMRERSRRCRPARRRRVRKD
jgi:hypothetical protein